MQIGLMADSVTRAQFAATLANTPVKCPPTITAVLDPRSRTDAFADFCVQLRRHPPRGPRCQPRPQPPATATTPTATMAAASNARIWLLLFLADTLGRATD